MLLSLSFFAGHSRAFGAEEIQNMTKKFYLALVLAAGLQPRHLLIREKPMVRFIFRRKS
jgi:hypothetical protein